MNKKKLKKLIERCEGENAILFQRCNYEAINSEVIKKQSEVLVSSLESRNKILKDQLNVAEILLENTKSLMRARR